MGTPIPEMEVAENASAEALLSSLKTIDAAERRRHAMVFNYWLSIRKDRAFPPIRDLDPLEISDAGPQSLLLEMIGGGEDADIRHLGSAIRGDCDFEKICDAPSRSLLSCIGAKLPIVAATRDAFAFEEDYETGNGPARCWVTLLPFSAGGTLIDFVYGFVSIDQPQTSTDEAAEVAAEVEETAQQPEDIAEEAVAEEEDELLLDEPEELVLDTPEQSSEEQQDVASEEAPMKPGFSGRFSEKLKSVTGFYGRVADLERSPWKVEETGREEIADESDDIERADEAAPADEIEPAGEAPEVEELGAAEEVAEAEAEEIAASGTLEPIEQDVADELAEPCDEETNSTGEEPLQTKLTEVRAKADEARQAKLRANAALYEGLSAAYDFALDAEEAPEEYLKLVEGQGLKIQLRSPMKPVVKLAFDGMCDDATIAQLEGVLSWALKQDLPRGSLAEHIQSEGGIAAILGKSNGKSN